MIYENVVNAVFIQRKNRFVAEVEIDGKRELVHVKNTGRLGELLLEGVPVCMQDCSSEKRKTRYDIISVYKEGLGWVNIDSQATNKVVFEWLLNNGYTAIHPEYTYGASRLDFSFEKEGEQFLMEVKGCTLEKDGIGFFPDAVSERAVKHCKELIKAKNEGKHAILAFVIAME